MFSEVVKRQATTTVVSADDIVITNIRNTDTGVMFDLYVNVPTSSPSSPALVLPVSTVQTVLVVSSAHKMK